MNWFTSWGETEYPDWHELDHTLDYFSDYGYPNEPYLDEPYDEMDEI